MKNKYCQQYKGPLTLRQITEGVNLAIRNSYRLLRSAELLFENKDYAGALALAILALEENGKYPILISMLNKTSDVETDWKRFRSHKAKTKKLNALLAVQKLLPHGELTADNIKLDMDKTDEIKDMFDVLKQKGLYVDCIANGRWQYPQELFDNPIFVGAIMATVKECMWGSLFSEEEIVSWHDRAVLDKKSNEIDRDKVNVEITKDYIIKTLRKCDDTTS